MNDGNPFGFTDHRPFSGFSDELIFGITTEGAPVHISDAMRGLSCNCTCPACDRVLVAKKGNKQRHHFAHYNRAVTCSHVAETNAHIWAKEVLEREKRLSIPAVVASYDGLTVIVSPEKIYEFAHARLEKRLDTIVPDVILVTDNGTQLIVEVRVTHACEETKLAKLRSSGVSAIEIDLRRFRTSTDREAVEDGLLSSAPRDWLSNAKQVQFDERLRDRLAAEAKRNAAAEAQKLRRAQEEEQRAVNRVIGAVRMHKGNLRDLPQSVQKVLDEFDDVPWSQRLSIGFAVHPFVWQAELVTSFLTYPNAFDYQWADPISTDLALRTISHHLIPALRGRLSESVRARLHDEWPRHRVPAEAVEDFLDSLVGAGYLWLDRAGQYIINEEYADQLCERERHRQAYQRRLEDLRRRVEVVLSRLPALERESFDLDAWLATKLQRYGADPNALCRQGDDAYLSFERELKRVELLSEGGPITEDLLELPLVGEISRADIRKRDMLVLVASQRRSSLTDAARLALGEDANAWLSGPSEDDYELTRIDQAGVDDLSYQRARGVLEKSAMARQAAIRARDEASLRRDELRKAGTKVFDPERLDLFLGTMHPSLGKSPLEYCVDSRTLRECLALLPRAHRGKFR